MHWVVGWVGAVTGSPRMLGRLEEEEGVVARKRWQKEPSSPLQSSERVIYWRRSEARGAGEGRVSWLTKGEERWRGQGQTSRDRENDARARSCAFLARYRSPFVGVKEMGTSFAARLTVPLVRVFKIDAARKIVAEGESAVRKRWQKEPPISPPLVRATGIEERRRCSSSPGGGGLLVGRQRERGEVARTGTNGPRPRKRRRIAQVRFSRAMSFRFSLRSREQAREQISDSARYFKARLRRVQTHSRSFPSAYYFLALFSRSFRASFRRVATACRGSRFFAFVACATALVARFPSIVTVCVAYVRLFCSARDDESDSRTNQWQCVRKLLFIGNGAEVF
ncbi:uncharacterized protein LOC128879329 [Hylaeus volcanicus]|uniref:uncharacterized protein LOC128879329 n=1 Tax=Hylaeus volcanicus TaxID=313075 RepID=UPI0023B8731A|nr:uncharacterized protein LOC128879329 [Hylaeus volcanicus]